MLGAKFPVATDIKAHHEILIDNGRVSVRKMEKVHYTIMPSTWVIMPLNVRLDMRCFALFHTLHNRTVLNIARLYSWAHCWSYTLRPFEHGT